MKSVLLSNVLNYVASYQLTIEIAEIAT